MSALAICFASCGIVLMLALFFIARSSPIAADAPETPGELEPRPMDLEAVHMEGYQVLEIYNDAEHWSKGMGGPRGVMSEHIVRTAKVRDPETGRVSLVKVQTLVKPW